MDKKMSMILKCMVYLLGIIIIGEIIAAFVMGFFWALC